MGSLQDGVAVGRPEADRRERVGLLERVGRRTVGRERVVLRRRDFHRSKNINKDEQEP